MPPSEPKTIAITALALCGRPNEVTEALRADGCRVILHPQMTPPSEAQLREYLAEAEGLIAGSEPLTRAVLEAAPRLRVIARMGVGYDAVDLRAATDLGIVVAYVPDAMVDTVADLAWGLLIGLARRIPELDAAMKADRWQREIGADVSGRTLGVIGTGRIGMAVARRAAGFRMRLLGYDPYPNPLFVEELGGDYVSMDDLLSGADFVTVHVPVTEATRGLMGAAQFRQMKRSAFFINTARGALMDQEALYAALQAGELAGAELDVFAKEPPDPHPLWRLPNVIATPHVASYTPRTVARMGRAALQNLRTALAGERPEYVANPAVYEGGQATR